MNLKIGLILAKLILKLKRRKTKRKGKKAEKTLAEEQESQVKVEPVEEEDTSVYLDVPTSNKFAVLKVRKLIQ